MNGHWIDITGGSICHWLTSHALRLYEGPKKPYKCESWTMKKAECQRIDAFKSWCCRRPWMVPWTTRRLNQSILINPDYSLEGLVRTLKLQYFGHLMWRANSAGKTLMLGKIEGKRRRGWQRMRWLDSIRSLLQITLVDEIKHHSQNWNWMTSILTPSSLPLISNHSNDFDKPSLWFNMDVTQKYECESELSLGDSGWQKSLACCSP